jgi:hypothetical protein
LLYLNIVLSLLDLHLTIRNVLDLLILDLNQFTFLKVKFWVGKEGWHFGSKRLVVVVLDSETRWVTKLDCVDLRVGVHICKVLVLLLHSSEFQSALDSSLCEDVLGSGEGAHQIDQVTFFETVAVGLRIYRALVAFTRPETHENLVVTKIVSAKQGEVFIFILDTQTQGDSALKNHIEFSKLFTFLDDSLVSDEHTAVKLGHEE